LPAVLLPRLPYCYQFGLPASHGSRLPLQLLVLPRPVLRFFLHQFTWILRTFCAVTPALRFAFTARWLRATAVPAACRTLHLDAVTPLPAVAGFYAPARCSRTFLDAFTVPVTPPFLQFGWFAGLHVPRVRTTPAVTFFTCCRLPTAALDYTCAVATPHTFTLPPQRLFHALRLGLRFTVLPFCGSTFLRFLLRLPVVPDCVCLRFTYLYRACTVLACLLPSHGYAVSGLLAFMHAHGCERFWFLRTRTAQRTAVWTFRYGSTHRYAATFCTADISLPPLRCCRSVHCRLGCSSTRYAWIAHIRHTVTDVHTFLRYNTVTLHSYYVWLLPRRALLFYGCLPRLRWFWIWLRTTYLVSSFWLFLPVCAACWFCWLPFAAFYTFCPPT